MTIYFLNCCFSSLMIKLYAISALGNTLIFWLRDVDFFCCPLFSFVFSELLISTVSAMFLDLHGLYSLVKMMHLVCFLLSIWSICVCFFVEFHVISLMPYFICSSLIRSSRLLADAPYFVGGNTPIVCFFVLQELHGCWIRWIVHLCIFSLYGSTHFEGVWCFRTGLLFLACGSSLLFLSGSHLTIFSY